MYDYNSSVYNSFSDIGESYTGLVQAPEISSTAIVSSTVMVLFNIILIFAILLLIIVSTWKIFKKAGKPGWASIVPIYNTIVLFQISGLNPWLILLYFIPFVNFIAIFVLMILVNINLAKAFGKGIGYTLGLIFLNVIFVPILAFSDAEYQGV